VRPHAAASLATLALVALAVTACGENGPATVASEKAQTEPLATQPTHSSSIDGTDTGAAPVSPAEAEAIVRAWSAALNAGDNEAAADLFAAGALVIQAGVTLRFDDRADAVSWNAGLPCSGTIVDLAVSNAVVVAVFALDNRLTSSCDAPPGTLAAAAFLIENGKIAVWQQVSPPENVSPGDTASERAASAGSPARHDG
jgi:hypothetical protein